jgi:hypothetical protein
MGNGRSTSWYWNCGGGGGVSASFAPLPQLKKLRGVTKLALAVGAIVTLPLAMNAMLQYRFLARAIVEMSGGGRTSATRSQTNFRWHKRSLSVVWRLSGNHDV